MSWTTTVTPPLNTEVEILCVMFDDDEHRTLQDIVSGVPNREILKAYYFGDGHFKATEWYHPSGEPFWKVVAWRFRGDENDLGEPYYNECMGECIGYNNKAELVWSK